MTTIRPARASDADAIASILSQTGWFPNFSEDSELTNTERIRDALKDVYSEHGSHSAYVAESDDAVVVAYLTVQWFPYFFLPAPEGYVSEIFVDERWRGLGIGQRLIDTVVEEARARGCSRLMLCNSRNRDSYKRGFYQKLGWQEREAVANFILRL